MKRIVVTIGALLMAVGLMPATAHAVPITTQTFCVAASNPVGESSSCPDGLGAFLSITATNLALNQYDVALILDSTLVDPVTIASINQVQFDIAGYNGSDYESKPILDVSGVDGGTWSVFFDNLNNGPGCAADNLNAQHVCAVSPAPGTDTGDVDVWLFHIDLADALPNITDATDLNLRAQFLTNEGKNGGILSPDFANIPNPPDIPTTNPDTTVPEPTSLILLGTGLAYAGTRLRRRRSE